VRDRAAVVIESGRTGAAGGHRDVIVCTDGAGD
jgi:hypothetical protein